MNPLSARQSLSRGIDLLCPWRSWFCAFLSLHDLVSFAGGASGKEPVCQCTRCKRHGLDPWVGKIPRRRSWQPTPVFLPGESHGLTHGQGSLVGYSPWGRKELDTTEQLHWWFGVTTSKLYFIHLFNKYQLISYRYRAK